MALIQLEAPYRHWQFQDPQSGDLLRLVPERGGLITGWRCQGRELLYLDEARFADPGLSVRGGIPVLFPICGGLPDDRLSLPVGDFTLHQHGFARDLPWWIEATSDGAGVAMELGSGPESLKAFPFPFRLRLEARLADAALLLTVSVTHQPGAAEAPAHALQMPFSFGLHPYFNVSALQNVAVEGLPAACFDHTTMAEAFTGELLPRLASGIDLLTRPGGDPVRLRDRETGRLIELQSAAPWDLVVLWSEPPRPMVCLEPWTGPRQSVISGDRRLSLAAGETMQLHSRFQLLDPGR